MYKPPDDLKKQTLKVDVEVDSDAEASDSDINVSDSNVDPSHSNVEASDSDVDLLESEESPKMALDATPVKAVQAAPYIYDPGPWAIPEKRKRPTRNFKVIMILSAVFAAFSFCLGILADDLLYYRTAEEVAKLRLETPSVAEMKHLFGSGYGKNILGEDSIRFYTDKPVKWKGPETFTKLESADPHFDETLNMLHFVWNRGFSPRKTDPIYHKDKVDIFRSGNHIILHDKSNNQYWVYTHRYWLYNLK